MTSLVEFWNDPLRLTLLVAGVIVIVGIYVFGRRGGKHHHRDFAVPNLSEQNQNSHAHVEWDSVEEVESRDPPIGLSSADIASALEIEPDSNLGNVTVRRKIVDIPPETLPTTLNRSQAKPLAPARFDTPIDTPKVDEGRVLSNVAVIDEAIPSMQNVPIASVTNLPSEPREPVAVPPSCVVEVDTEIKIEGDNIEAQEFFAILHVVAKGKDFPGKRLQESIEMAGMEYGDHRIFHFMSDDDSAARKPCFSLVNMMEPGIFDLRTIDAFETTGVSLFMRLPGPMEGLRTFSNMLVTAQALARRLDGQVLDEQRLLLSQVKITQLRAEVAAFDALVLAQSSELVN